MKKIIFALAAIALAATACEKAKTIETPSPYSNVKVNLTVTAPESTLTKANYDAKDAVDPLGGFNITWKENDIFELIIFQGDNSAWTTNYIHKKISLPAEAEGKTTYDLSSLVGSVDLSGFDDAKNLKYVVVYGGYNELNTTWQSFTVWNGYPWVPYYDSPSEQIHKTGMLAETDVQEIAFPSGDLTLSGKLKWMTSILAFQFDIDPAADISYPSDSKLVCMLDTYADGARYQVDSYYPITRMSENYEYSIACPITFNVSAKLSDALDANNCRYFAIPSDDILDAAGNARTLGGATIQFRQTGPSKDFTSSGTLSKSVPIEAGKVYGVKIKVTDSDSDGNPEFAKL